MWKSEKNGTSKKQHIHIPKILIFPWFRWCQLYPRFDSSKRHIIYLTHPQTMMMISRARLLPSLALGRARLLSTTTPEATTPDATTPETAAAAPLFPWRSSPIILDRLQDPDDLSGTPSQTRWSRWARQGLVARQLQVGWLPILLGSWKGALAEDMGWAFQKGLAGVVSKVLKSELKLYMLCCAVLCCAVASTCLRVSQNSHRHDML